MSSPLGALVGALVGGALCLAVPWLVVRTSEVPRGRRLLPGAVLAGFLLGILESLASMNEIKSIIYGIDQIIIYLVAIV